MTFTHTHSTPSSSREHSQKRILLAAAVGTVVIATAACSGPADTSSNVASAPPSTTAPPAYAVASPKAVLDLPRAVTDMADYDKRYNAAIRAEMKTPHPKVWQTTQFGPASMLGKYSAVMRNLRGAKAKEHTDVTMQPELVYASDSAQVPSLALVAGPVVGEHSTPADEVVLRLMAQLKKSGPWVQAQSIHGVKRKDLPKPVAPGAAARVSDQQLATFATLRPAMTKYMESETTTKGFDLKEIQELREDMLDGTEGETAYTFTVTCMALPDDMPGTAAIWRVEGGAVGVQAMRCQRYQKMKDADHFFVLSPADRRELGVTEKQPRAITSSYVVETVVTIPDSGPITVIGYDIGRILTAG